jgi:hypothetical protein
MPEIRESEFRVRGKARRSSRNQHLQERLPLTSTLSPQERGEGERQFDPNTSPHLTQFVREKARFVRNFRFRAPAVAAKPRRDEPASNVCAP